MEPGVCLKDVVAVLDKHFPNELSFKDMPNILATLEAETKQLEQQQESLRHKVGGCFLQQIVLLTIFSQKKGKYRRSSCCRYGKRIPNGSSIVGISTVCYLSLFFFFFFFLSNTHTPHTIHGQESIHTQSLTITQNLPTNQNTATITSFSTRSDQITRIRFTYNSTGIGCSSDRSVFGRYVLLSYFLHLIFCTKFAAERLETALADVLRHKMHWPFLPGTHVRLNEPELLEEDITAFKVHRKP